MNQPEILDQDIRALQEWLRTAWQQLADPALTTFMRRELRNQMKQCSADLRAHLEEAEQRRRPPDNASARTFSGPDPRILTSSEAIRRSPSA
jgi:hypothetical protein